MKIYNSYANKIEEFIPINDNKVKIYVCGPTVYDFAHLGHARCYITWDMVVRYLRFRGYEVTYSRNVTDVDDKIINKAKAQNTTPEAIATEFYEEFTKSLDALNCVKPDIEPLATKTIGEMIALVKKLETNGYAYNVDGDVFFRVGKFADYGKLSNQKIEDLESGARVESDERKESPLDFALWKSVKDDTEISWPSPWGKGRPGWHLECSAMINKVFKGEAIDIHAGGQDLLFPHHENEIAQSCCAYDYKEGQPFVKYWMHNGFVTINEEKMSKSLGNFVTINKLLEQYDANTIRLFILTNHYRMPVGFNDESLTAAQNGMKRIKNAVEQSIKLLDCDIKLLIMPNKQFKGSCVVVAKKILEELQKHVFGESKLKEDEIMILRSAVMRFMGSTNVRAVEGAEPIAGIVSTSGMDNDFNTSSAIAVLFQLRTELNEHFNNKPQARSAGYRLLALALLLNLADVLGFDFTAETKIEKAVDYPEMKQKLLGFIKSDEIISKSFLGETMLAGSENIPKEDKEMFEYALKLVITSRNKARAEKQWEYSDKIRDGLLAIGVVIKDTKEGTTWILE